MKFKELEVRFLEIDVPKLKEKLYQLGAIDNGEELLKETIFFDKNENFNKCRWFVRTRQTSKGVWLTYKNRKVKERES
ncbi:hypothetical protein ACFLY7_00225 [Patescibacteria group bacterium]